MTTVVQFIVLNRENKWVVKSKDVERVFSVQREAVDDCAIVPDSSCRHPAWFSMMTPRPRRGGLAITCKFARMMGGDVTVTSEPGKSSVLRCACRAARA